MDWSFDNLRIYTAARDVNSRLQDIRKLKELDERDVLRNDELFNKLFPYESLTETKRKLSSNLEASSSSDSIEKNMIKPNRELEREHQDWAHSKVEPSTDDASNSKELPKDFDKAKSIAFNSREVRLMGPDQREVEMKDDFATKFAIVLDNLKTETSELMDQVNDKLDKGWTDFVKMIEKATSSQGQKKQL